MVFENACSKSTTDQSLIKILSKKLCFFSHQMSIPSRIRSCWCWKVQPTVTRGCNFLSPTSRGRRRVIYPEVGQLGSCKESFFFLISCWSDSECLTCLTMFNLFSFGPLEWFQFCCCFFFGVCCCLLLLFFWRKNNFWKFMGHPVRFRRSSKWTSKAPTEADLISQLAVYFWPSKTAKKSLMALGVGRDLFTYQAAVIATKNLTGLLRQSNSVGRDQWMSNSRQPSLVSSTWNWPIQDLRWKMKMSWSCCSPWGWSWNKKLKLKKWKLWDWCIYYLRHTTFSHCWCIIFYLLFWMYLIVFVVKWNRHSRVPSLTC